MLVGADLASNRSQTMLPSPPSTIPQMNAPMIRVVMTHEPQLSFLESFPLRDPLCASGSATEIDTAIFLLLAFYVTCSPVGVPRVDSP
jgi:hypothetical protein